MAVGIAGEVVNKIHKHNAVEVNSALPRKAIVVDKKTFEGGVNDSLPVNVVVSPSSKPSWWSPSAANIGAPAADLELLLYAKHTDNIRHLDKAWLGF